MRLPAPEARSRLEAADHGILGTLRPDAAPDLVPVCFAVVRGADAPSDLLAVPIDRVKEKSGRELRRVANLRAEPRATLLCERWDAGDWTRLWWVRARLLAVEPSAVDRDSLESALRAKYRQYREASEPFTGLLAFTIESLEGWSA